MGIGLLMAYFHWSILNLVTLPQSLWSRRRRTEHLQTWLALIPRFPHYLLRWFHFSSFKNEMVPDFFYFLQVWADVTPSYLSYSSEEAVVCIALYLLEPSNGKYWRKYYVSKLVGVNLFSSPSFSLFLSLFSLCLLFLSLYQPGADLVKHFRTFFIDHA